jgi:DNA-binding winged helix-turn-helix (wHTH) protein
LESQQTALAIKELGKLYFDRCDYGIALDKFVQASEYFEQQKDFENHLKCLNFLLRIHAEREDAAAIQDIKTRLQNLVIREGMPLSPRILNTMGRALAYQGDLKGAHELLQKAVKAALQTDNKVDLCYAINGLSTCYYLMDQLQDSLREIYNLRVFLQVLNLPEVKLSSQMINAHILRKTKRYDEALEMLWQCYDSVRVEKNMYMYVSLLYGMGLTYKESGLFDIAKMYLTLAKSTVDPVNLKYLARQIDLQFAELEVARVAPIVVEEDYDLIFQSDSNSIVERKKGRVDFGNQFVLLDMLRLFLAKPGHVYSKESLVQEVWQESYDPAVHDNKIYVSIKRLRRLIEPDYDHPRYICRAKNGYFLKKDTKILMQHPMKEM